MIGAGIYDSLCTQAREEARAKGAVLIICEGEFGNGFSVQLPSEYVGSFPAVLRQMADTIEHDWKVEQELLKVGLDKNKGN